MIKNRDKDGRIISIYDVEYMKSLAEEYDINRNALEISRREGICTGTLYYNFKKFGVNKPSRTVPMNEAYFENIDTEAKSYLLGFIMADGCVSITSKTNPRPNRLSLNISTKDRYILELLKSELECDYNIKDTIPSGTYSTNSMSRISVNSIKLCDDLAKLGVVQRKTGKETLPVLSNNMYRHFIRGFLDGDGWITKSKNSSIITIGFVSNRNMLLDLKQKLYDDLKLGSVSVISDDTRGIPLCYLRYHTKSDILKLKHYLYHNSHFYLERKYSKLTF